MEINKRNRNHAADGSTALYRHFCTRKRLLYVGISLDPLYRTSQHQKAARWFYLVRYIEVEYYETRKAALIAEAVQIKTELPLYNLALNSGYLFIPPIPLDKQKLLRRELNTSKQYWFSQHEVCKMLECSENIFFHLIDSGALKTNKRYGHEMAWISDVISIATHGLNLTLEYINEKSTKAA